MTWPKREAGAFTLSYVLVVPIFMAAIMTIVQASIWYLARETVLAAARQGADVARTAQSPPGAGAQAARNFAATSTPGFLSHISVSTRGTSTTTVRVTVSARIPTLVPDMVINVHEVVTAPVERFVALGLPALGLPARGLPARGLPARGLPARGLPARGRP